MIFKGYNFRRNKNIVMLPNYDEELNSMPYVEDGHEKYVYFGRVIKQNEKKPINAIKTRYKWNDSGEDVFAIPIEIKGHSLTSMAYGTKNQVYLAKDGNCYQSRMREKQKAS